MLPREISLFGIFMPSLLLVFLMSVALHIVLDWACGHFGIYRMVWHRSLFRLSLLVCLFGVLALIFY